MGKIDLDFFEKVLFQHCLKKDSLFLASCVEHLDSNLFRDKNIGAIVQIIKDFYLENSSIPSHTELKIRINTSQLKTNLKNAIDSIRGLDQEYAELELLKNTEYFIKQRSFDNLLEKSIEQRVSTKELDLDNIQKENDRIQSISLIDNLGLDYFGDIDRVEKYLLQTDNLISSGYPTLDDAFGGGFMREGRAIYDIGGETNIGKAQPISLEIRTPDGVKKFGDLKVGDSVFGKNGLPIKITHIHPQGIKKIYKVSFMDGRETYCCPEHLWTVWNSPKMRYDTLSTETIKYKIENYTTYKNRLQVPLCEPIEFNRNVKHVIHPYVMGCLLGDGGLSITNRQNFTNFDEDCLSKFKRLLPDNLQLSGSRGTDITRIDRTTTKLKNNLNLAVISLGLNNKKSDTKFIPEEYMFSSIESRFELLNGLIDTDGHINTSSSIEILLNNQHMIHQIAQLVYSLGGNAKVSNRYVLYKGERRQYFKVRIRFPHHLREKLELIPRKMKRLLKFGDNKRRYVHNSILSITEHSKEEAMCITVDAADSLYLTNDYIVTHNSIYLANIAVNLIRNNENVVLISPEMSENRYAKRISGILTGIALANLPEKIDNFREYINDFVSDHKAKLIIKEVATKSMSAKGIKAFIQQLERKKKFTPNLIAIDGHALLKPSTTQPSKHTEMQYIVQECRGLSYVFNAPVLTVAQLNRSSHKATNPGLDTMSSSWDQLADFDAHLNIWQTDIDREENIIRFGGKKVRDGQKGVEGFLKIDYDTLRLYEVDSDNCESAIQEKNISQLLDLSDL